MYDSFMEKQKQTVREILNEERALRNATMPMIVPVVQNVLRGIITMIEDKQDKNNGVVVVPRIIHLPERQNINRNNQPTQKFKGLLRNTLTWEQRSCAIFCYLHPGIYGSLQKEMKLKKISELVGIEVNSLRRWVIKRNQYSKVFIPKWYDIVNSMQWKDVRNFFFSLWADQWNLPDNSNVQEQIKSYKSLRVESEKIYISNLGTKGIHRKKRSALDKAGIAVQITKTTKRTRRSNKGKPLKYLEQNEFVKTFITNRWNEGLPATRTEVYNELRIQDNCQKGHVSQFWEVHLDDGKTSHLANFLTSCLRCFNFSVRKESIGQVVPDNWEALSKENAKSIRDKCKEFKADVVLNADQTFVRFYSEEGHVICPTGSKRVGGKVKADVKAGFTLMLCANMDTSSLLPPYIVYTGTKIENAKRPLLTNAYKYKDWTKTAEHRKGYVDFQEKHWFDADIFMRWLLWLLEKYPGKRIALIIDKAPCQTKNNKKLAEFLKKKEEEGVLIIIYIDGGLTSVLQVCDLCVNKEIKRRIKAKYYDWRTHHVRMRKANGETGTIKLKIHPSTMADITEYVVQDFNTNEKSTQSIRRTFLKAGQNQWMHDENLFESHLSSLKKDALYKDIIENQTAVEIN